ncbi:MAG: hypothetical protein SOW66_06560 [Porphyromonas sp.]|nr:hypothetical protein [Porphyromonas sp.]
MKRIRYCLLVILSLLLMACSRESEVFNTSVSPEVNGEVVSGPKKYLSFASRKDFNLYIEQLKQGGDALRSAHAYARYIPKGFKSIASLRQEQLRSMPTESLVEIAETLPFDDISEAQVDTEMTSEEFALFRAEELILDPTLRFALDTTLRVEIADSLYAVTEVGTFVAPLLQEEELNRAIEDFRIIGKTSGVLTPVVPVAVSEARVDTSKDGEVDSYETERRISELTISLAKLQPGQVMPVGDNVYYIDSYGVVRNASQRSPSVVNHQSLISAPIEPEIPAFHKNYNVDTYPWKEKTIVGKLLGSVFGHNISRENYFDEKHRVQLVVYDVDLGFLTTTGIKARLQYRKRFLGLKFWKEAIAEKMVVGFNQFHAEITDEIIGQSLQNPVAVNTLKGFQATVSGQVSTFATRVYKNIDFIDDWAHEIAAIVPSVEIGRFEINPTKAYEFLYNAPRKEIISLLNKNVRHMVFAPFQKKALEETPRMGFFPDTKGKSQVYAVGVSEYENVKGKSINLNLAAGLSFSYGGGKVSISPFKPREVTLKSFDMFVSVKRDGVWKGVRFIHNI